jgi:hypothetical protein
MQHLPNLGDLSDYLQNPFPYGITLPVDPRSFEIIKDVYLKQHRGNRDDDQVGFLKKSVISFSPLVEF